MPKGHLKVPRPISFGVDDAAASARLCKVVKKISNHRHQWLKYLISSYWCIPREIEIRDFGKTS